jgi:LacI family transcriptional regulator
MSAESIPRVALLIETSRSYGRRLLRGIVKYARLHGPWAFYNEPGDQGKAIPRFLKNWHPDGIILRDVRNHQEILSLGVPVICSPYVENIVPGVPNIVSNNAMIGKVGAEHLLERGFKQFAYFSNFDHMFWSQCRCENFKQTISKANFSTYFHKQPRLPKKLTWEKEQDLIIDWLKKLPKPIGLMVCNDDCGRHIIEACKIADMHVPSEIAVLGVDNDELICELSNPPLSSISRNTEKVGYEAAKLLDKMMAGAKFPDKKIILQPTHVVTRQSTDILAIENPSVASAIRFILENSKKTIQVSDVVNEVLISRRHLERMFKQEIGCSINDEIRRIRVEQIVNMLIDTNESISQIASILGYASIKHIARYFRREKGMSPLAYRKKYGVK